jgi:glycosyl transferase family 25
MHVFWINLDERQDRQREMQEEMKLFPTTCTFERISAIKHSPGCIGCSLSHIKVLETAIERDLPYVCIVEDDMQAVDPKNIQSQINAVHEYIAANDGWNVIILGAFPKNKIYQRKNEHMIIAKNMQTTVGYIVNNKYYNKLLTNYKEGVAQLQATNMPQKYALDQYWKELQEIDEWLCVYPYAIKQRPSYSSIEDAHINYDVYYNTPIAIV